MLRKVQFFLFFVLIIVFNFHELLQTILAHDNASEDSEKFNPSIKFESLLLPTIQVIILVHPYNKAQYLPYSLGSIESQFYDKDRIRIKLITERISYDELSPEWSDDYLDEIIQSNELTIEILKRWAHYNREVFNEIELSISNLRVADHFFSDSSYWNQERYKLIIDYKNQELYKGLRSWADWVLFYDADVILPDRFLLVNMTKLFPSFEDLVVVAPMLYSLGSYSNFWGGMDQFGYYVRTDDYLTILEQKQRGTFSVPMIHSCVFVNTRLLASRLLTFDPVEVQQLQKNKNTKIPFDDIIAFAKSASLNHLNLYIDNRHVWGYIPAPITQNNFSNEEIKQNLIDLELESLVEGPEFPVSSSLEQYVHSSLKIDSLEVDWVYIINLARRKNRKRRMVKSLKLLGIKAQFFNATDGKQLTEDYLKQNGIRSLEGYADPYHKRPITFGEIGCFLSHYRIWEDAFRNNYSKIIILEDDVRFDRNFRSKWSNFLKRFELLETEYDFLYLGRKHNSDPEKEKIVDEVFVEPFYSYWTIGYLITRKGIEKLLKANPTSRMVPVDEFLPLMYGSHTNETLVQMFGNIEPLRALSLRQLIISPTHYVGDELYISDTEDSHEVNPKNSAVSEEISELNWLDQPNQEPDQLGKVVRPPPIESKSYLQHLDL